MQRATQPYRTLTFHETKAFLDAARSNIDRKGSHKKMLINHRMNALLELTYATGVKTTELLTLPMMELTFETVGIHVTKKNGDVRMVPLTEAAIDAVQKYVEILRQDSKYDDTPWLFPSPQVVKPINRQTVNFDIKKICNQIGLERPCSLGVIRNSFATHFMDGGADVATTRTILGHRWIENTEDLRDWHTSKLVMLGDMHPMMAR